MPRFRHFALSLILPAALAACEEAQSGPVVWDTMIRQSNGCADYKLAAAVSQEGVDHETVVRYMDECPKVPKGTKVEVREIADSLTCVRIMGADEEGCVWVSTAAVKGLTLDLSTFR